MSDDTIYTHEGKSYTLTTDADLTNRVFPGWWGDAKDGEEYTSEWSARATGEDGESYLIIWQFDAVRGEEPEDGGDWPWESGVYEVRPL